MHSRVFRHISRVFTFASHPYAISDIIASLRPVPGHSSFVVLFTRHYCLGYFPFRRHMYSLEGLPFISPVLSYFSLYIFHLPVFLLEIDFIHHFAPDIACRRLSPSPLLICSLLPRPSSSTFSLCYISSPSLSPRIVSLTLPFMFPAFPCSPLRPASRALSMD